VQKNELILSFLAIANKAIKEFAPTERNFFSYMKADPVEFFERAFRASEEEILDAIECVKTNNWDQSELIMASEDTKKTKTTIAERVKTLAIKLGALGSCPKCGYGFAGKKPDVNNPGKMVKLEPSDPKFDPTQPCPSCEMTQLSNKGKEDKQVGFGEKYYVHNSGNSWIARLLPGRQTDLGYVGPFYQKSDAQEMKEELEGYDKESAKWSQSSHSRFPRRWRTPKFEVVTENQMHDQEAQKAKRHIELAQNQGIDDPEVLKNWGDATPSITSPKEARDASQTVVDFAKQRYYEKQEPNKPNIAKTLKKIKIAQEAISDLKVKLTQTDDKPLLPLLQEALKAEFQQWDLYYAYKSMLKGLPRDPIADHFEEHAGDEAEHIDVLQRYIVGMGEVPTVERRPIPTLEEPTIEAIIAMQLKFELEAVDLYKKILGQLEDTSPLKLEIENILIKEQEHAHDLQLLLRK